MLLKMCSDTNKEFNSTSNFRSFCVETHNIILYHCQLK